VSHRHYSIRHRTIYDYEGEVVHAHQLLHLVPRACERQTVRRHAVEVTPAPASRAEELDAFGNPVTRLEFDRPHKRLDVVSELEVEVRSAVATILEDGDPWEAVRDVLAYHAGALPAERLDADRFRLRSPYVRLKTAFADYAEECFAPGVPIVAGARALMTKINGEFTYSPGETTVATPLALVLEKRRGVCQDFAHLMIACLRSIGLAARYVSGYLRTIRKEVDSLLAGADASHAWVSVYCPPLGWIDLDPTNGVRVDTDHVTLAWGRDFGDVSPLRGVLFGGGRHTVAVEVSTREVAFPSPMVVLPLP
jgi:transglutaminase-like putative cysteine protease